LPSFVTPTPYPMTVERRDVGRRTVLAVSGEVDIASSPTLRSSIEAALEAQELCVDLRATTFMDSSGLHVLLEMHRLAEGRLTIICPPGNVRRVFDLTGASRTLRVRDGRHDA
jgi:anti-sigma B factor antagonist